jgi:peptide methionine sulfoxide reductase MsrA
LFIEFNPRVVSYRDILEAWQDNDYPWEPEELPRHTSAILYCNDRQYDVAAAFLYDLADRKPDGRLYVDVRVASTFYQAEALHQKYMQKQLLRAREQLVAYAKNESSSGLFAIPE